MQDNQASLRTINRRSVQGNIVEYWGRRGPLAESGILGRGSVASGKRLPGEALGLGSACLGIREPVVVVG